MTRVTLCHIAFLGPAELPAVPRRRVRAAPLDRPLQRGQRGGIVVGGHRHSAGEKLNRHRICLNLTLAFYPLES